LRHLANLKKYGIASLFIFILCTRLNAGEVSSDHRKLVDSINLNQQEIEWINTNQLVKVAVKTGWMPIEFKLENETNRGISMDYLNEISALTGIKFEIVDYTDSLDKSQVQVISAISGNQDIEHFYKVE